MGDELQTYVGNGKKIQLSTNIGVLRVIGNNCVLKLSKNEGQIVFTGNKGHLQVTQNTGKICYTGNSGLIEVGTTSKGIGQVVYTGNGGVVRRVKTEKLSLKKNVGKNSTTPLEPKRVDSVKIKKEVENELRINGVEVCINPKFKQTKESVEKKFKTISTAPLASCCQQARNILWQNSNNNAEQKTSRISVSSGGNIELVNVHNFELENWCLNLATELVAL